MKCRTLPKLHGHEPVGLEIRGIRKGAHGFIFLSDCYSQYFPSGAGMQIKVAGFNVYLWRLPILDKVFRALRSRKTHLIHRNVE